MRALLLLSFFVMGCCNLPDDDYVVLEENVTRHVTITEVETGRYPKIHGYIYYGVFKIPVSSESGSKREKYHSIKSGDTIIQIFTIYSRETENGFIISASPLNVKKYER